MAELNNKKSHQLGAGFGVVESEAVDKFSNEELIKCGSGELFGKGNPRLPSPPMLMFDEIDYISFDDGLYGKGLVKATLKINPDLWFFSCHFKGDPVMPGCLGLDAMWQLLGFYLGWIGGKGIGRALSCSNVKFADQVLDHAKIVSYQIDIKRVLVRNFTLGVADGLLFIDGKQAYEVKDLRVGLFTDL